MALYAKVSTAVCPGQEEQEEVGVNFVNGDSAEGETHFKDRDQ